ncbi:MAG: ATP-binding protein [Dehalococcoidales bacterium]|nr:ATP-binding protein [Dehalococcoidales bacterium]
MFSVDMRTVILFITLFDGISLFFITFLWLNNRQRFSGMAYWVADYVFLTVGMALSVLRGSVPDFLSLILSNFLLLSGTVLLLTGLQLFFKKPVTQITNYILLVVFIFLQVFYVYVRPDLFARTITINSLLVIFSAQFMYLLFHSLDKETRQLARGIGWSFTALLLVSAIRIVTSIIEPHTNNDFFTSDALDTVIVIGQQLTFLAITYSLIMLVNSLLLKESHQTAKMLSESEGKFSAAFRSSPYAITITQPQNGLIIDVNNAFENITGFRKPDIIGHSIYDIHLWINENQREEIVKQLEGGTQITHREFQFRKKTGEICYGLFFADVIQVNENQYVLSSFTDITNLKKAEADRDRTSRLETISTLAGGIAHDFNNLLTGIMGNISISKVLVDPDSEPYQRLEEAEKASLKARDLTRQLLTFARGGAPVKKLIDISDVLHEMVPFTLRGSNARGVFHISDDLWQIEADEGQINQVVNNLVLNAVQSMPQGGEIIISAENKTIGKDIHSPLSEGKYILLTIQDSGTGIPQEHFSKVFDPYFTTKPKGSGLGLTTAYSIVKRHEGHIYFDSAPGKGATFYVYLPASDHIRPFKQQEKPAILRGSGRILVMDDEESILKMLRVMLATGGYEVSTAVNGESAIRQFIEAREIDRPFKAVILDLTIPGGMGGRETMQKLLEIDPKVIGIVSSGYATDPIMSEYQKYGFSAVVSKPYSIEAFLFTLHEALNNKTN